jgi:hypothetical protein
MRKLIPYVLIDALIFAIGIGLTLNSTGIDIRDWQWWVVLAAYVLHGFVMLVVADVDISHKESE